MSANSTTTIRKNETAVVNSEALTAYDEHLAAHEEIKAIDAQIAALKLARAELVKPVQNDMKTLGITKIVDVSNATLFTNVTASRTTVDSKRLRDEKPEIFEDYSKTAEVTTFKVH